MSTMSNARWIGGPQAAVAAAGNSQETATALTGSLNVVTSATATSADGVRLPESYAEGDLVLIVNSTNVALDVFPPEDGAINGGTANAAKALVANMSGLYVSLGSDNWGAVLSA